MDQLHDILRLYEKQQEKNHEALERRKREVFEKVPRIEAIDKELALIGVEVAKAVFQDPNRADAAVAQIKNIAQKLKREKLILLTDNNFPVNYLELQYQCKQCKDTGFVIAGPPDRPTTGSGKRCKCFEKQLIDRAYSTSNLGNKLLRENFSTFNSQLFSEEPINGVSPRANMEEIVATAKAYIKNIHKRPADNLLFTGHTGLGKTFLCSCIAKALIDNHLSVIYQTAFQLMDTISRYKFSDKQDTLLRTAYELIFNVDLLIIDDLGTEMVNNFTQTETFNIINSRLLNDKPTIVSTNLTPIEISQVYGERLGSRILGHYDVLFFTGTDIRLQ